LDGSPDRRWGDAATRASPHRKRRVCIPMDISVSRRWMIQSAFGMTERQEQPWPLTLDTLEARSWRDDLTAESPWASGETWVPFSLAIDRCSSQTQRPLRIIPEDQTQTWTYFEEKTESVGSLSKRNIFEEELGRSAIRRVDCQEPC
jgi:hypothetical protein